MGDLLVALVDVEGATVDERVGIVAVVVAQHDQLVPLARWDSLPEVITASRASSFSSLLESNPIMIHGIYPRFFVVPDKGNAIEHEVDIHALYYKHNVFTTSIRYVYGD